MSNGYEYQGPDVRLSSIVKWPARMRVNAKNNLEQYNQREFYAYNKALDDCDKSVVLDIAEVNNIIKNALFANEDYTSLDLALILSDHIGSIIKEKNAE